MRKIRLSDTDLEMFDIEICPLDFTFYQKHKDAFRTMWKEQGKPFWTRFAITFRSFTVKHGVIKQMNIDSPKFQNLIDQAFIYINEQFVYGKENMAKNFIEDVAKLAQNQDKFPALDSKSFTKDPFYAHDTRELFRRFFGPPDQKSSYLKVYILCPVYLRFGGSVCRCLVRWTDAPRLDPNDDSYWTPPAPHIPEKPGNDPHENSMCSKCIDDCGTQFFKEKIMGAANGPKFITFWTLGDPRFKDKNNPLFAPHLNPAEDWRNNLSVELFRDFLQYSRYKYGAAEDKCQDCVVMKVSREKIIHVCRASKKKKKKETREQEKFIKDLKVVRSKIDELTDDDGFCGDYEIKIREIINAKPKVAEALAEAEKQDLFVKNEELRKKMEEEKRLKKRHEELKKELHRLVKRESDKIEAAEKQDLQTKQALLKIINDCEDDGTTTCHAPHNTHPDWRDNAEVTNEQVKFPLLSCGDITDSKTIVAGFKVIKIVDEANGFFEVNVSVANLKSDDEEAAYVKVQKDELWDEDLNAYILNAHAIRSKIDGLPELMEWWEARGLAVAILNYAAEEKEETKETQKWTNFAIRISGYDEEHIKQIMIKLLIYVGKRKRRTCVGWNMEVDDVVACLLPEDSTSIEDLSISIQRGFRFQDRLTEQERDSLVKHQPNLNLDIVAMGIDAGEATKILNDKGGNGKENMKKIFSIIAGKELFSMGKLPDVDIEKLREKLNGKEEITTEDILWEQLIQDPDKFDFMCLVDKQYDTQESYDYGWKPRDIQWFMANKNPDFYICHICKAVGHGCPCETPVLPCGEVMRFLIRSIQGVDIKVLGEENNDSTVPKMVYKGLNAYSLDANELDKDSKKSKKSAKTVAKKNKEKRIELVDLPAKFQEVGIVSEKTTISIPANADAPLMGSVPLTDRADRMAPIPGLTSSLNFTFQNDQKEQTITVSLGAYMPEDKIKEIEDKKEIIKIIEEDAKREQKIKAKKDKKDEKKKRREKNGKGNSRPKSSPTKVIKPCKTDDTEHQSKKEKEADITSMFLREILGQGEGSDLSKQINTLHGIDNKKQMPKMLKKSKRESSGTANGGGDNSELKCTCFGTIEPDQGTIDGSGDFKDIGNGRTKPTSIALPWKGEVVDNSPPKLPFKMEEGWVHLHVTTQPDNSYTVTKVSHDTDSDDTQTPDVRLADLIMGDSATKTVDKHHARCDTKIRELVDSNQVEKSRKDVVKHKKSLTTHGQLYMAATNRVLQIVNGEVGADGQPMVTNGDTSDDNNRDSPTKDQLKDCSSCGDMESSRKQFKKCQKCKEDNIQVPRYYCSRECQVEDWRSRHKLEHRDGLLH